MKRTALFLFTLSLFAIPKVFKIVDRPISFSKWRVDETIKYINERYGRHITSIKMDPIMVVVHWTAIYSLEESWKYMNREKMPGDRKKLQDAGLANIAVHFLIGRKGEILRLMPEDHIGRHTIGLNRIAIGIENVGGPTQPLTDMQLKANAHVIREMKKKFNIRYLIGHMEYREFEKTPLWEEKDPAYRTEKDDPGADFMKRLRAILSDLNLLSRYRKE